MMRAACMALCAVLVGPLPASANTMTWTYTGQDYTSYSDSSLDHYAGTLNYPFTQSDLDGWDHGMGPRMSLTVSFNFIYSDIFDVTGTFKMTDGVYATRGMAGDHSDDYVGTLTATSGSARGSGEPWPWANSITLVHGTVTDWNFDLFIPRTGCGTSGQYCDYQSSLAAGDHMRSYTGYTGAMFSAGVDAPGSWSSVPGVPGPVAGAGLPGLLMVGLLGWWRRKRQ